MEIGQPVYEYFRALWTYFELFSIIISIQGCPLHENNNNYNNYKKSIANMKYNTILYLSAPASIFPLSGKLQSTLPDKVEHHTACSIL